MNNEILTKILASLALLVLEMQTLSKYLKTNVDTLVFDKEFCKALSPTPPLAATPPPVVSNEPVDKAGVPWTESIHAATKKQTAKGLWKRRQGVTVEEYDRVTAEILAAPAPAAGTITPDFPPVPGVDSGLPPVPGVDSGLPPGPGGTVAPVNEADKTAAMTAITLLTDEFGLSYESVLKTMDDEFSVSSFDELPAERYPEANTFFTNWANEFRQCDEEIEKIVTIAGDNGQKGVDTIMGQNKVSSLETTPYNSLRPLHSSLIAYREQLDAWVASQK